MKGIGVGVSNWKFEPFGTHEIRPQGWLMDQLKIQATGLCGNLDEIWPDIRDSKWIGGDNDGWERVPYWLDGFIPLAWLLDDKDMKDRGVRYIDGIISGQHDDGWICPCAVGERSTYDIWAYLLITKVLAMYADFSDDERIKPVLTKALYRLNMHLDDHTLFNWGAARWYEGFIPIYWLYEKIGEDWLLDLAQKLMVEGFNYYAYFENFRDKTPANKWSQLTHVVNLSMCLRQDALVSRLFGGNAGEFPKKALEILEKYHGMANGHFTGDECLSGTSPIQGTELCAIVEAMYSYANIIAATGEPEWGDRLEKLAFNALPAAISEDMWSHQYLQMTNQIKCVKLDEEHVIFRTNGAEAHLFGLEPNYGCCTANFNQAWPKLVLSSFMKSANGIVSTVLVPSKTTTRVREVAVECVLDTEYPFKDELRYTIYAEKPVEFTFSVRIPGFVDAARVDGKSVSPGSFAEIRRKWQGHQTVTVNLCFEPQFTERPSGMHTLWNGPLLYSLPIEERWEKREYERNGVERKHPYCDYEVFPESKWNFGFAGSIFDVCESDISETPFSASNPPISINAIMAQIPWEEENGVCTELPLSYKPKGDACTVKLIPYGCARLRMTEMPKLFEGADAQRPTLGKKDDIV